MAKKKPESVRKITLFRWRPFLQQVSKDVLKDIRIREDMPAEVITSKWMGYKGASEKEIADLERCLGKKLPPSYRSFLAETNGWRNCGPFIYNLWSCKEVRWFKEKHQDWINAYVDPELPKGQKPTKPRPITDKEYLTYGEKQDSCSFRTEYLQTALEISDEGDSAVLLLNPEIVTEDGEWEAWFFANWMPGAHRYRSFQELMQGEHASFCKLFEEQGPGASKYGNTGQQAALRGETAKAIAILRRRLGKGDLSSAVSLAELCAFTGQWDEVIRALSQVMLDLGRVPNHDGYHGLLLQLLGRAGHETGNWKRVSEVASEAIKAEKKREYDQYHEWARSNKIKWFSNLKGYCMRKGAPPHELVRIFGVADPVDAMPEKERRAHFAKGVKDHAPPASKRVENANYQFALARSYRLGDELVRIYEELPDTIYFNGALDVSREYMKRGDQAAAWRVLETRMEHSVGGCPEFVAPIVLLVDDVLRPLMTRERCNLVLSTARGREAAD